MEDLKAVFITFNQAYEPIIIRKLKHHSISGYTLWSSVQGKGSNGGNPHLGSHAWPTLNSAIMTIIPSDRVKLLLNDLKELDNATPEQGLRAFVLPIEDTI